MIRVTAPSRLHFGLFNPGGVPGQRSFGGLGLMIASPAVVVAVKPSDAWHGAGPNAERALAAAKSVVTELGTDECLSVEVEACPPAHVGLGVGTQLALAAGTAADLQLGVRIPADELALCVGRGKRSAIGVEGFRRGGFIVDDGKADGEPLGRLVRRIDWPVPWVIVLARPGIGNRWCGAVEVEAFARPRSTDADVAARLRDEAVNTIAPALANADHDAFGEGLYEFNRAAGAVFRVDQGGTYSSPVVERLVAWFRDHGVPGCGQSSWGPTVFAVCRDFAQAEGLAVEVRSAFPDLEHVSVTAAANSGASYETIS